MNQIRTLWAKLGQQLRRLHREHRFSELPELCRRCRDWQVAGAQYEEEKIEGTRPFWFKAGEPAEPGQQSSH